MDEDLGVKVTVTRLRRRLSVESEDSTNSPLAPSTPTKKRGGRLAAKPQLELIDEASENVPKKTPRKSIARDIEPSEEKVLTPARRSARIRSNTSLLAEATTPKVTDSPRAKRAVRRTSQVGSDNDTPVAPVRQTRRTRKNSTASMDIAETENEPPNTKNTDVPSSVTKVTADDTSSNDQFIVYVVTTRDIEDTSETQTVSNNNTNVTEEKDTGTPTPRKSPRLQNKKGRKSKTSINDLTTSEDPQPSEEVNNVTPEKTELNKSAKPLSVSVTRSSTDALNGASIIKEVNVVDKESETLKPTSVLQELNHNKGSPLNKQNTQTISAEDKVKDLNTSSNKVNVLSHSNELNKSDTEILLEKAPGKIIQSFVVMEDSDSNSGKLIMDVGDDQCVPVVENQYENNAPINSEVEPMDIDETIPNNITINDFIDGNVSKEATVPITNTDANISKFLNQSSILSVSVSQDMESKPTSAEPENISKNVSYDGETNISLNNSRNKSRRSTSVCIPLESERNLNSVSQSNKSKRNRKSSISALSDSNTNLNQSSNKSRFGSPSNKEIISLNASSNKSQLNYSVQLGDDVSKKMSSSICSADKEEKSVNKSRRKSSLSDTNNSKLPQSPKNSDNDTSKKSRNSSQHAMATERNYMGLDNSQTIQDPTEKNNQSKRKSSLNKSQNSKANIEESTNDKNTSNATIAQADSQNLEKSMHENKSTLVLSQLKDMSTNDTKNESNNDTSRSGLTTDAKNSKKNITENYSTSTPLQQKSMQKLAMQINTSIISPSVTNNSVDVKAKNNISAASSDSSDSSDEEERASKDRSKMIDDEASEASDDYESGDSRDEDERRHEEENEIREKGETLESEQDFSNDSDYEKDSFIVSSDEEDDDMLSGTGDDLSLSDRELTLSKKSKKKYDERKRKEQKKASREMFEARHNISKEKSKNTKPKALESSDSESDDKGEKPKKKNRRRLDSSVSVSKSDADESIVVKKKKVKRLSESVCDERSVADKSELEESFTHKQKKAKRLSESFREETATANEKEITICNESSDNNKDPLVEAIKLEPKTPQKGFNISTVPIVDNMEEVQVDANMTVLNSNETSDPLQMTMVQDEDSLSSENAEIMENYDSVLNNLNKNQKKIKNLDNMSLNIDKKSNGKAKEPIIDQLNLTQTKVKKDKETKKNKGKPIRKEDKDDSDSSDSIDMQLLFPEDSNDSETHSNKLNKSKKEIEPAEEYIPLKKTPGKTHIPVKMDISASLNKSGLNNSKKDKFSLLLEDTENSSEPTDDGIKIFIDTTGTLDLDAEVANSASSKKKKKKHLNKSGTNDSIVENNDAQNVTINNTEMEPPLEVLFKSDKKKKNKTFDEISITYTDTESNETNKQNVSSNIIEINETEYKVPLETPKSEKKKKNKNNDVSIVEQSSGDDINNSAKKKAKKSTLDVTEDTELNTSQKSEKKKKKNKVIEGTVTANNDLNSTSFIESIGLMFEDVDPNLSLNTSVKSDKKKKKNKDVSIIESDETEIPSAKKKSKKLSETVINADNLVTDDKVSDPNVSLNTSVKSDKKKKKNKDVSMIESNDTEIPSAKKKSNKLSETVIEADNLITDNKVSDQNVSLNTSVKSDKKKKKNKDVSVIESNETEIPSAKKKSNKSAESIIDAENLVTESKGMSIKTKKKNENFDNNTDNINNQNKKSSENLMEDVQVIESKIETVSISDASVKSKKKKKNKRDNNEQIEQNLTENAQVIDINDDSNDAPEEVVFKFEKATTEEINEPKSMKRKLESENPHDAAPVLSSKKKRKLAKAEASNKQEEVDHKASKKRKRPDGGVEEQPQKVFKENSQDNIHVPRLPTSILDKLNEKPQTSKKIKAIATSNFIVEDARPRKNKPSTYLEQSVYLNDTPKKNSKKKHKNKEIPVVLPFIPTAAISDQGYTSKFKINVLPQEMQFVATSNVENFKNDLLNKQRIKKMGTFEKFKSQRSRKLCKF